MSNTFSVACYNSPEAAMGAGFGSSVFGGSGNATVIEPLYFHKAMLLFKGNEPVGKLCLYNNPYLQQEGKPMILIGNFDCIPDTTAANVLFDAAYLVAADAGIAFIAGPMNGSTWHTYRFAAEGTAPSFFTEIQQPDYYAGLWEAAGFTPVQQYYSTSSAILPKHHATDAIAHLAAAGISLRPLQPQDIAAEAALLYPLCMAAFAQQPFFSPISRDDFIALYLTLKTILDPRLTILASNSKREPLAFMLGLPDYCDSSGKTAILKTIAKDPSQPLAGLMTQLGNVFYSNAAAAGFTTIIHAFMHEQNRSRQRSQDFNGSFLRRYALYLKAIPHGPI